MNSPLQVLCAGLIVADHVSAPIPSMPSAGSLVVAPGMELTIGGCAANTATDLAKIGVRVGIVGCIGADPLGNFVRQSLIGQGVDDRHLQVSTTQQTAATLVINVVGEDRRFIHAVGANAEFTGTDLSADDLRGVRVLCVGGFGLNPALSGENVAALFQRARAAGVMTVLDVVLNETEDVRQMFAPVLPWTDLFLPNRDESTKLLGETDPALQVQRFLQTGVSTVIITCGGDGLLAANQDGVWQMPAHQVRQIDGTGGGDAFVAGYLLGVLENLPLPQRLAYGAALGASCVQSMGATTGVFDRPRLLKFVAEHPLPVTRVSR